MHGLFTLKGRAYERSICKGGLLHKLASLTVLVVVATLLAAGFVAVQPQQAHAASAVNKKLLSATYYDDDKTKTKTIKKYDITGDGKADTIKLQAGDGKVCVYVGGTLRGTVKYSSAYHYEVKYLCTSNGHPFLLVEASGESSGTYALLQYKSGAFKKVVTNSYVPKSYGDPTSIDAAWASGKQVKVRFESSTNLAGLVQFTYTYNWKGGTLKRASATAPIVSVQIVSNGYVKMKSASKTWLTLVTSVKLRKTAGGSSTVTTAATGTKVKLVSVRVKSGKLYFKLKTASGKQGWLKGKGSYTSGDLLGMTIFDETVVWDY